VSRGHLAASLNSFEVLSSHFPILSTGGVAHYGIDRNSTLHESGYQGAFMILWTAGKHMGAAIAFSVFRVEGAW
jgi:hypothetical protein